MKPDELERLLWEEADGTIGEGATRRLRTLLDGASDAEAQRRRVADCARLLAQVHEVPAPPTLVADIARRVAAMPQPRGRSGFFPRLLEMLALRRVELATAAVAVAVVAGAILVLVLSDGSSTRRHDVADFYGAMTGLPSSGDRGETVALPSAMGTVTIIPSPGSLVCRVQTVAPVNEGVTLRMIGAGVAVASVEGDSAGQATTAVAPDSVDVRVAGAGVLTITASVPSTTLTVTVEVWAGGRTVAKRSVRLGLEGAEAAPTFSGAASN